MYLPLWGYPSKLALVRFPAPRSLARTPVPGLWRAFGRNPAPRSAGVIHRTSRKAIFMSTSKAAQRLQHALVITGQTALFGVYTAQHAHCRCREVSVPAIQRDEPDSVRIRQA